MTLKSELVLFQTVPSNTQHERTDVVRPLVREAQISTSPSLVRVSAHSKSKCGGGDASEDTASRGTYTRLVSCESSRLIK